MPLTEGEIKALAFLKKEAKLEPIDSSKPLKAFPTGSIVLDALTGCGGLPEGRIIEISGPESSGKSTLATVICGVFQKKGKRPCYIDVEQTFDSYYASKLGFTIGKLDDPKGFLFHPSSIEEATQIAIAFGSLDTTGCVVLDSVAAARPQKELDGSEQIGLHSVRVASFVQKIIPVINKTGCVLVGVNQNRTKMQKMGPRTIVSEDVAGGRAWKYHCTCRFGLRICGTEKGMDFNPLTGKEEEVKVSNRVRINAIKNKAGIPHRTGEIIIKFGEGIDNIATVIELAEAYKILVKSANGYFKYEAKKDPKRNFTCRGVMEVRDKLRGDQALMKEIIDRIGLDKILANQGK